MDQIPSYETLAQMSSEQLQQIFGIRDFFVYSLEFPALAAAASGTGQFTIEADANFLWQYGAHFSDIAGAVQTDSSRVLPLVTATIQDSGSGRQLMNSPVPIPSLFGHGPLPFLLPTPRFFRAQTTISINVTNFSAATTYNLRLQFIGTKFFKFAQAI